MTKDFAVQNAGLFGGNKTFKKDKTISKDKLLVNIFDKYDLDKNGEISTEEAEKAQRDLYSYCDKNGSCFYNSVSHKNRKELKAQGLDLKALARFEYRLEGTPYIDGKVTAAFQGRAGDCWLLSGINALNTTAKGKEYIKQAIKINEDGTYSVALKGVNKTYNLTNKDLEDNFTSVSRGDNDVKLIEIAVKKYNRELIETKQESKTGADYTRFVGNSTKRSPLKGGGTANQAIFLLTGKESKVYTSPKYMYESGIKKGIYIQKTDVDKYLDDMMNGKSQYATLAAFKKKNKKLGMYTSHAYAIKRVEKDCVIITNPWNSSAEISVPRKEFMENVDEFSICDLNK